MYNFQRYKLDKADVAMRTTELFGNDQRQIKELVEVRIRRLGEGAVPMAYVKALGWAV